MNSPLSPVWPAMNFFSEESPMRAFRHARRRRGVAAVEFAVVAPVVLFFIFAQIIGGLGVFRYQEVAHLAREGARYASTHGGTYQQELVVPHLTTVPAVASSSDMRNYLIGRTVLLDADKLQVTAAWTAPSGITPANTPIYVDTDPTLVPPGQKVVQNNVRVTVTYQWLPEMYVVGPITLTSTSEMPMVY